MRSALLFCLLFVCAPALAAPGETRYEPPKKTVFPDGTVVIQDWPRAPKGDIRVLLRAAMNEATTTDSTNKAAEVGERQAEALPFLESYSHTNHDNLRFAVLRIAENGKSKAALHILSNILVRPENLEVSNVGEHVLKAISRYNRDELVRWGDTDLRDHLIEKSWRGPARNTSSAPAILLLSAFPDARTRGALEKMSGEKTPAVVQDEAFRQPTPRAFAADLVLADWGEARAMKRIQEAFARKPLDERIWLCRAVYRLDNPQLLGLFPAMLTDSRVVRENVMYAMGADGVCRAIKSPPTLMSDLAWSAMQCRVNDREFDEEWNVQPKEKEKVRARFAALLRPRKS